MAGEGIHVILVEPGAVETALWYAADEDLERTGSRYEADEDLGRTGSRYEEAYRRARVGIQLTGRLRASAEQVAKTVVTALTAKSPRPRYLVGLDAQWAAFLDRLAPTWISDRVKRLPLGL